MAGKVESPKPRRLFTSPIYVVEVYMEDLNE